MCTPQTAIHLHSTYGTWFESISKLFAYPRTYLYPWIKPKTQYMILGPCPYKAYMIWENTWFFHRARMLTRILNSFKKCHSTHFVIIHSRKVVTHIQNTNQPWKKSGLVWEFGGPRNWLWTWEKSFWKGTFSFILILSSNMINSREEDNFRLI